MKFFSRIRFRKRRHQNPAASSLDTSGGTEIYESIGNGVEESSAEEAEETEMEDSRTRNGGAETLTFTAHFTAGERNRAMDRPPADDCCPICFGGFVAPCRGPCGHWYCGGCILEYWNHAAAFRPCKCPMCSRQITKLTPDDSLYPFEDAKAIEVLDSVQQYNCLFVGGAYGLLLKFYQFPLYTKRLVLAMMDPDRPVAYLSRIRIFAVFLGALYTLSPLDFLPTGRYLDAMDLFDCSAITLSFVLYFAGLYLRRRRQEHVRRLAAIQPGIA